MLVKKISYSFFALIIFILLTGCGSNSSGVDTGLIESVEEVERRGFVIDSAVEGLDYECADKIAKTSLGGLFVCPSFPVTFSVLGLRLGTLSADFSSSRVYVQDIMHKSRDNFSDEQVIKLGLLLQSLDSDGNTSNGILLRDDIIFNGTKTFEELSLTEVKKLLEDNNIRVVSESEVIKHLREFSSIDTIAPIITLIGDANISIKQNVAYVEQGARVKDNKNVNVSLRITGTVDSLTIGTYSIFYDANDTAGNKAETITRIVNVLNPYTIVPTLTSLTSSLSQSIKSGENVAEIIISNSGDSNISSIVLSGVGHENFRVSIEGIISVTENANFSDEISVYNLTAIAINEAGQSSSVSITLNIVKDVPQSVLFDFGNSDTGLELWRTTGESSATQIVKDIFTGSSSSFYVNDRFESISIKGISYFSANDNSHGFELWKSDGTISGTVLLKDIYVGADSSSPLSFTEVNGTLYFVASNEENGTELWKSDGSEVGTVMVKDIYTGSSEFGVNSSFPFDLTEVNGTLYFSVTNENYEQELWRSDGTQMGTQLLKNVSPSNLTAVNGSLYFTVFNEENIDELWKSDGTEVGTGLLKKIGSSKLININGTLYFSGTNENFEEELWKSDGTQAGTQMLKSVQVSQLSDVNGTVYFQGYTQEHGYAFWKSDGSSAGTIMVKDFPFDENEAEPSIQDIKSFNGEIYIIFNNTEFWKSDGTEEGSISLGHLDTYVDVYSPTNNYIYTTVNGKIILITSETYYDYEYSIVTLYRTVWVSDGTLEGTSELLYGEVSTPF